MQRCAEQILNLNFTNAYDSIERAILFNILAEFGADDKSIAITKKKKKNYQTQSQR